MFQSKYMKIIPHTHQWSEGWSKDTSYHWHECTADGCNITDNSEKNGYGMHTGGTATCTDKAVCTNCGEAYGNVDGTNHTNLVKTEAKPAKHLAEGNKEYYYCEGCNQYFCDKEETKKIAITDTVMPKLTEHTADASGRHSDENVHWSICECGEKLNEEAHIFEWVVGKEATETEVGSKHEKCTVCGYEKGAVEIPAEGTGEPTEIPLTPDNTQHPQTGDNSKLPLWLSLLVAASAAMNGTVVYGRKKKYGR